MKKNAGVYILPYSPHGGVGKNLPQKSKRGKNQEKRPKNTKKHKKIREKEEKRGKNFTVGGKRRARGRIYTPVIQLVLAIGHSKPNASLER